MAVCNVIRIAIAIAFTICSDCCCIRCSSLCSCCCCCCCSHMQIGLADVFDMASMSATPRKFPIACFCFLAVCSCCFTSVVVSFCCFFLLHRVLLTNAPDSQATLSAGYANMQLAGQLFAMERHVCCHLT